MAAAQPVSVHSSERQGSCAAELGCCLQISQTDS
jgi:hypothetical protein